MILITNPIFEGPLTQHLIVVTHKGKRYFKVEVHYGKRGMDVDCWDLESTCLPESLEDFGPIQEEILKKIGKRFNDQGPNEFCLQLTSDQTGPTSTPRQRVYRMWFFDADLGVDLGGQREDAPDTENAQIKIL